MSGTEAEVDRCIQHYVEMSSMSLNSCDTLSDDQMTFIVFQAAKSSP